MQTWWMSKAVPGWGRGQRGGRNLVAPSAPEPWWDLFPVEQKKRLSKPLHHGSSEARGEGQTRAPGFRGLARQREPRESATAPYPETPRPPRWWQPGRSRLRRCATPRPPKTTLSLKSRESSAAGGRGGAWALGPAPSFSLAPSHPPSAVAGLRSSRSGWRGGRRLRGSEGAEPLGRALSRGRARRPCPRPDPHERRRC